ncbi:hypothetical protein ABTD58_19730, partial [Acinetobacter baumannii]
LPILPGQDVALFNGLFQYLYQNGHADQAFVEAYTEGLQEVLASSQPEADIEYVAKRTGIALDKLQQFVEKFAQTEKV